jgi:tetratricopeptide (TPR) repeat protein
MKRVVYIVSDPRDNDRVLKLSEPLETAGFTVVHNEAVGVGESLIGTATQHLRSGVPVVLCATVDAVARRWSRKLVNAAHAIDGSKVLVVEMDDGLDLEHLSLNTVAARYYADPGDALAALIEALNAYFPKTIGKSAVASAPDEPADYLDQITSAATPSIEALAEYRGQLREDIAARYPPSLSAWEFLQRTSVLKEGRLTRIGVLLFGENPAQVMPSAVIECSQYDGTDRTAALTKVNLFGTLQAQLVEANQYIADRVRRGEAPTPIGPYAQPVYAYPMIAVREIVANAVAHRDYSVTTSCIHVRIFVDRIEITNPGTWTGRDFGPKETQRIDRLVGESSRRNFRLATMLTWIWLVEGEGKGIRAVAKDCRELGAPIPTVRESGGIITVTIYPKPRGAQTHAHAGATAHGALVAAAHGDGGMIHQGPGISTVVVTAPPMIGSSRVTEVAAPACTVKLPWRAPMFVGRYEESAELEASLSAADPGVLVIHGLGGIGKSTLAAAYASASSRDRYNPVWWVTADSTGGVEAGLAELTTALLPGLTYAAPQEDLTAWATAWLAAHDGWLLVLDDVDDPADIAPLLARVPNGRVIVTSRLATGWHQVTAATMRLDVLAPVEAIDLLVRIAAMENSRVDLVDAAELCAELGYLPLAVEQAAAYLRQSGLTPRAYLARLAASPARTYGLAAVGSDAERTITRTWRLTLDRMSGTPLAGRLLRVLAWYGPESIPRAMLDDLADPDLVGEALGQLAAFSLVSLNGNRSVSMHRLLQAFARTPDPDDPHRQAADIDTARDEAIRAVRTTMPQDWQAPSTWPAWRSLLPHIVALLNHAPPERDPADLTPVLVSAGRFVQNQGALDSAIDYFERALGNAERLSGPTDPVTLACRNDLAGAYRAAGDLGRAVPLLEATLADYVCVLGEDHPDTLGAGSNLAGAYRAAGDLGRAIPLYEQIAGDRARVLGEDHPSTLASRNNLGGAYQEIGDLGRAVPLLEAIQADYARVLGPEHPDMLSARSNLAYAYEARGDLDLAVRLYEDVLDDRERVLGPDHPDTLAVRNNLASAYDAQGDLTRAVQLYERTLDDRRRVLGEDHPDTLGSRNNLGVAYAATGDTDRAIPIYQEVLADVERILGPEHPDSLAVRNNLADAYRVAGELEVATTLLEQVFADSARLWGPDHPRTRAARRALASAQASGTDLPLRAARLVAVATDPATVRPAPERKKLRALRDLLSPALPREWATLALGLHAGPGKQREHTLRQVAEAISDAIEADVELADRLRRLVDDLGWISDKGGAAVRASGTGSVAIGGTNAGIVVTGDGNVIDRP